MNTKVNKEKIKSYIKDLRNIENSDYESSVYDDLVRYAGRFSGLEKKFREIIEPLDVCKKLKISLDYDKNKFKNIAESIEKLYEEFKKTKNVEKFKKEDSFRMISGCESTVESLDKEILRNFKNFADQFTEISSPDVRFATVSNIPVNEVQKRNYTVLFNDYQAFLKRPINKNAKSSLTEFRDRCRKIKFSESEDIEITEFIRQVNSYYGAKYSDLSEKIKIYIKENKLEDNFVIKTKKNKYE